MKKKSSVLIVDDERSICETLKGIFSDEGWESKSANNGKEGLELYKKNRFDLVLLDIWMEGMDGIETLQKMKAENVMVPIVIMSGHGTIETAVKVTKLGAMDFLEKPLSLEKLLPLLEKALAVAQKPGDADGVRQSVQIIGRSKPMQLILRQISMVAPRHSWVLITGENGTGKEVVAQNIHSLSPRATKPFVAVNCAAIPEELIESELFGHTKGAFTNAFTNKKGKFELANHGTLFLDEIGDMSLKTQAKILRILQEQSFEPVGGDETISVDVRVIAATNKNLVEEIAAGNFREDLYYRLNVIPIHMPPLRERGEDIFELIDFFFSKVAIELGEPSKRLGSDAKAALKAYSWPGNVRELRNLVERLSIMVVGEEVVLRDLPETILDGRTHSPASSYIATDPEGKTLKEARSDFERSFILESLERNDWNVSKTAEAIGIERSNLHRKLKAYHIDTKGLKG